MRITSLFYSTLLFGAVLLGTTIGCGVSDTTTLHLPKGHLVGKILALDTLQNAITRCDGIEIYDASNKLIATTDTDGYFDLLLQRGTYDFTIRKAGFGEVTTRGIEVVGDSATTQYLRTRLAEICMNTRCVITRVYSAKKQTDNNVLVIDYKPDSFTRISMNETMKFRLFDHAPLSDTATPIYESMQYVDNTIMEDSILRGYDTALYVWIHKHWLADKPLYAQVCVANGHGYYDPAIRKVQNHAGVIWSKYLPITIP